MKIQSLLKILNLVSVSTSHLWRYGIHPGAVLIAFVVNEAQLAEQHREHPEVFLELPQPVLVCVGVVGDSVRKLRSSTSVGSVRHLTF